MIEQYKGVKTVRPKDPSGISTLARLSDIHVKGLLPEDVGLPEVRAVRETGKKTMEIK